MIFTATTWPSCTTSTRVAFVATPLGRSFALALVKGGRQRHGQTLYAPLETRTVACRIVDPVLYDPEGKRRDG